MAKLVTIERARQQLRELDTSRDAEIDEMIEEASATVLDYIGRRGNPDEWEPDSVPREIRRAVLLELGAADRGREGAKDDPQPLSDATKSLLRRWRDPVLA